MDSFISQIRRSLFRLPKYLSACMPSVSRTLLGVAAGLFLVHSLALFRLSFGAGTELVIALLMAGCVVAGLVTVWQSFSLSSRSVRVVGFLVAVLGTALVPWSLGAIRSSVSGVDSATFENFGATQSFLLLGAVIAIGPVLFGALSIATSLSSTRHGNTGFLLGLALSACISPALLLAAVSDSTAMTIATAIGVLALGLESWKGTATEERPLRIVQFHGVSRCLFSMLLGVGWMVAMHLSWQLIPQSMISESALWGGLFAGLALSQVARVRVHLVPISMVLFLGLAVWFNVLMAGFPLWTGSTLKTSAWVSSTTSILAIRIGMGALFTAPLGYLWGHAFRTESSNFDPQWFIVNGLAFGMGAFAALSSSLAPTQLVLICSIASIVWAVGEWSVKRWPLPTRRWGRISLGSVACLAVVGMAGVVNYHPETSEKVLFSTQTFLSLRAGVTPEQLPWLDDGRLAEQGESLNGRWSLWRHRGEQVVLREQGVTRDVLSTDTTIVPNSAAEVVPALLPMLLNPHAETVLILDLHPSSMQTSASFPVHRVVAIHENVADASAVNALRKIGAIPSEDEVTIRNVNRQLALAGRTEEPFDVIVSPVPLPMTTDGASQMTVEFYQSVAQNLSKDGLFSQRLAYQDLGPEFVTQIVSTMKTVFPQVMAVESISGELVLIGALNDRELIDVNLIEQLQLPQSRLVLSQIGWDWSVPFSRGTLDDLSLNAMTETASAPQSVHASQFAFSMPIEVCRWGDKADGTRAVLSKHGDSLASILGDIPEMVTVKHRLDDTRHAQRVMVDNPDQFWAYRSVLKTQLKDRPRTKLMQVNGDGLKHALHPEDQRRKSYLLALGKVATQTDPSLEGIQSLDRFTSPYQFDPLVSHFVYHEIALLCERSSTPTTEVELVHRLHGIYYAPPQDHSVGLISRTMLILAEEVEFTNNVQRFDQLNSLMEVLKYRWRVRFQTDQSQQAKYDPIDTDQSIKAVEMALDAMDELHAEANVSKHDWEIRRKIVDAQLLRPLKRHRSHRLASYQTPFPDLSAD